VVNTVASTKGEVEDYRQVYLEGMRNLIAWLATRPPTKLVYTSSTSVYGKVDGSWVEETSATEPASETSRVLLETERVMLEAVPALPAVVLRVAGIYGPERGYWLRQYLKGEATMTGGGEHILNMIHREDVAGIIIAALERGSPGAIYNACDDEPVAQIELFSWLSRTLGRPMPPVAVEPQNLARKRGVTDKRVSNLKLKQALSYQFRYPSFREGFTEEIRRIGLR
jgi:nucleoside-diphosphate-sugar epimerase